MSCLLAAVLSQSARCADFDRRHSLFASDLRKYVRNHLVHYSAWKEDQGRLVKYLDELARIDKQTYEGLSKEEKMALWINAYNAATIKVVIDHYPIEGTDPHYPPNSLRQIPDVWEVFRFTVAGRNVSLYEMEHDILRATFRDPRTHFAVVCAAVGCAKLPRKAYVGETLDRDLNEAVRRYIADKKNVRFDFEKGTVKVPTIFKWFPLDFASSVGMAQVKFPPPRDDEIVLRYVVSRSAPEIKRKFQDEALYNKFKVIYSPSDWTLNDAG